MFVFFLSFQSSKPFKSNKPSKGYTFLPAGVVNVNSENQAISAFLLPETEFTNTLYRSFLSDLELEGKDSLYHLSYPDTSAWKINNWQIDPMANNFMNAPATACQPDEFNLYNMSGNAAELNADGVAICGHWNSTGYDIRITSEIPFEKPNPFVGFRPIIELS